MGDTVVSIPCLHLIARAFPGATRVMLTNLSVQTKASSARSVIGDSGLVHDYISYTPATRNLSELARIWWQIRHFAPDILIYLAAPRGDKSVKRDLAFFRSCGIRTIVGVPLGDLANAHYDEETGMWEHEALRLARTLASLGDANPWDLENWDLRCTTSEQRRADEVLSPIAQQPFLAAGIGTKMQSKDWGAEKWHTLIHRMAPHFSNHGLVFVGAKDDEELSRKVGQNWQGTTLNLCGQLSPRESAAVLRRAELFMGPDSGPMHLAASVGTPCAIVFSARGRPGPWYPFGMGHQVVYHKTDCFGCNLETCIEQRKKCLESIQVDEMFDAVMRAWQYGRQARETQAV